MIESEKVLERRLCQKVKTAGGWAIKMLATHVTGLPDRIVLLPGGRIYFVEVKTTNKKPRPIQLAIHRKLENLGFKVYIVDSSELIESLPMPKTFGE